MKKTLALLILSIIGLTTISAQSSVVKKIIEIGKTDNQTMRHLDILTNRFGGRPVGSDAYENAADWIQHEFKKWGIETYKEEAGEMSVGFNRGPWFGRMIGGDEPMTLHFATPSYTAGTRGVQRGHVLIEPKTEAEFNRMKHVLKGAWVLISGKSSGSSIGHSFRNDSLRAAIKAENRLIAKENDSLRQVSRATGAKVEYKSLRTYPALFYDEMVEAGVLGFIQAAPLPIRVLYDRGIVSDYKPSFEELPQVCDIKLDEHQYEKIHQMTKERRDFWLEFDIRNYFKLGPVKYHNIIGRIKGSKYPDEYVIISGHLDAYDVATGAVDCGTGIGPMMEVARLLALTGAKPKRTILFVAFAAEEFGLLGAQAFVKTHKKELTKIANLFNRDGGPTPPVGISVPQAMYKDFVEICKPLKEINPDYPFEVTVAQPRKKPTSFGGTDATVFAVEGVPTFGFRESDFKGYNFEYREIWHTERDYYNKLIPEYLNHTSIVTAIVALGVANLDHQLSREGMFIKE